MSINSGSTEGGISPEYAASADEALQLIKNSEGWSDAKDFGGPRSVHRMENNEWIEYVNGERKNRTQEKVDKNFAELEQHLKIIEALKEKGFLVKVEATEEITHGDEVAKTTYEQKVYATVFILRGEEIEMHNFEGTQKEFKEKFQRDLGLEDLMDDGDDREVEGLAPDIQPDLINFDLTPKQPKTKQTEKRTAFEDFWDNLFKPKSETESSAEEQVSFFEIFNPAAVKKTESPKTQSDKIEVNFLELFSPEASVGAKDNERIISNTAAAAEPKKISTLPKDSESPPLSEEVIISLAAERDDLPESESDILIVPAEIALEKVLSNPARVIHDAIKQPVLESGGITAELITVIEDTTLEQENDSTGEENTASGLNFKPDLKPAAEDIKKTDLLEDANATNDLSLGAEKNITVGMRAPIDLGKVSYYREAKKDLVKEVAAPEDLFEEPVNITAPEFNINLIVEQPLKDSEIKAEHERTVPIPTTLALNKKDARGNAKNNRAKNTAGQNEAIDNTVKTSEVISIAPFAEPSTTAKLLKAEASVSTENPKAVKQPEDSLLEPVYIDKKDSKQTNDRPPSKLKTAADLATAGNEKLATVKPEEIITPNIPLEQIRPKNTTEPKLIKDIKIKPAKLRPTVAVKSLLSRDAQGLREQEAEKILSETTRETIRAVRALVKNNAAARPNIQEPQEKFVQEDKPIEINRIKELDRETQLPNKPAPLQNPALKNSATLRTIAKLTRIQPKTIFRQNIMAEVKTAEVIELKDNKKDLQETIAAINKLRTPKRKPAYKNRVSTLSRVTQSNNQTLNAVNTNYNAQAQDSIIKLAA